MELTTHRRAPFGETWRCDMRGPGGPGRQGGPPEAERPAEKPDGVAVDVHRNEGFGQEFPWAHADLSATGNTYQDVGVRYKGNFTYGASAGELKRSLKIDFD